MGYSDFFINEKTQDSGVCEFEGSKDQINLIWRFEEKKGGYIVSLKVKSTHELDLESMDSLILKYAPAKDIKNHRVLQSSFDYVHNQIGFPILSDVIDKNISCDMITGLFPDNKEIGLFLGTIMPQNNIHKYSYRADGINSIEFTATTQFIPDIGNSRILTSESTWLCTTFPVRKAFDLYSSYIPLLPIKSLPAKGWNSWDYYYFTISMDSLAENMNQIKKDPIFNRHLKYIVVDEGWEHMVGEWYTNYKFPRDLEEFASQISSRGFIPGIWTSPLNIDPMSYAGWRMPQIMIKNQHTDPFVHNGKYLLDPTSPSAKSYLKELYTKLYRAGFRFFKVDFVSDLLKADRFYDKSKTPYEALRDLFRLIRECVKESHILGCSLPPACGPGTADSGRTGIDIHNQWNHLEWTLQCYTFKYWMNNRIWINDIDFLIVRGKDTSLEPFTNVMNPNQNNPNAPRWRRGPVFDQVEAQTWTNIVMMTGGNIFLSDRLSMVNEKGKELLYKCLESGSLPGKPLDLCCGYNASLWLQETDFSYRLTIINWSEITTQMSFDFTEYELDTPAEVTDFWTGKKFSPTSGRIDLALKRHESAVLSWNK